MDVFDLAAKIRLDTTEYSKGLDDSSEKTSSFASKLGSGLANAAKVATVALTAVTTGAVALGKQFYNQTKEIASYGDNIDKMSQKMGLSAEAYQEWDAIMQHSGTSIESLKPAIKTLATAAESGNEAFAKLGITQEEIAELSQEDLFAKVISELQKMEEGTERTYLAGQLLGRGATELGALLNTSAEDTEKMRQTVHELGGVMSNEAVKASAKYQDTLQDMNTAIDGAKRKIFSDFMSPVTSVMEGITKIFSNDGDGGIAQITEGLSQFVKKMSEKAPQIANVGGKIIMSLINAIADNLSSLLSAGFEILRTLATGIIRNIPNLIPVVLQLLTDFIRIIQEDAPMIMEAAVSIILTLAKGIGDSLPKLIPSIVGIILEMVKTLTDPENISNLVDAAIAIITGLLNGIVDAIPVLLEAAPIIIENLVTAIVENLPKIIEAAIDIIITIVEALSDPENILMLVSAGIKIIGAVFSGIVSLVSKIPELVLSIVQKIISAFGRFGQKLKDSGKEIIGKIKDGILSGIEKAKNWGKDLIDNFVSGIKEKWNKLKETVTNVGGMIKDFLGFSEPEKGPLSDFHTYAPDMMKLFAEGIRDNEDIVSDQIAKSFDFGDMGTVGSSSGYGRSYSSRGQNITVVLELDKQQFARTVFQLNGEEQQRMGVKLANV